MDFTLTPEQAELQSAVRSFCVDRYTPEALLSAGASPLERTAWAELAEMGVFSLCLRESDGGAGLGWAEAVLVFEELGRALAPGPLAWTLLFAGQVDGAADGRTLVAGAIGDPGDGELLIPYGAEADVVVVLTDDGALRLDAPAAKPLAMSTDPLTPVGVLPSPRGGHRLCDAAEAARLRIRATALVSAQLLGIAARVTEMSVLYAKQRHQFGRPIGSFQAVKHMCADMLVRAEVARAAVYAAGVTIDAPESGSPGRAASAAYLTASDAAVRNARTAVQVHGGMGYTWEVPVHLYLKRALVLSTELGSVEDHAEAFAQAL
jgi:alkylation response protein AidB-like acyl-CoA dehydrogenase